MNGRQRKHHKGLLYLPNISSYAVFYLSFVCPPALQNRYVFVLSGSRCNILEVWVSFGGFNYYKKKTMFNLNSRNFKSFAYFFGICFHNGFADILTYTFIYILFFYYFSFHVLFVCCLCLVQKVFKQNGFVWYKYAKSLWHYAKDKLLIKFKKV